MFRIAYFFALGMALAPALLAAGEPKPIGDWVFTPENLRDMEFTNLAGGAAGKLQRKVPFADAGETKAVQLDGGANAISVGDADSPARLLREHFTAEAWVRVDELRRWSRFVGVVARQNNQRKGWLIGTHYDRFVFSLGAAKGAGGMTDLHSAGSAHPGQWYHVAGTYDGQTMRLFVNGLLVGESAAQAGPAVLPTDTRLSMADYHDGAEFYPLRGLLHEVRVYDQPLTAEAIRGHYLAQRKQLAASPPLVMSGCFGDNMVLERDAALPVWGQTLPFDPVTVDFAGSRTLTVADAGGYWRMTLPKRHAGGPYEFTIETPRGKCVFRNVLVGEVWFCAGQSNLSNGTRRSREYGLARQPFPQIRLFTAVREAAAAPERFTGGSWEACDAGSAAEFSAVGFFFGRRLYEELKVPIGLYNASWGGTPIESWIARDAFRTLPEMAPVLEKSPNDQWERSGLYDKMVHPFIPYAIRGMVWYQGESNIGNPQQYQARFSLMIRDWRRRWGQGDFPFYFVQIAPVAHDLRGNLATAEVWDAQRRTLALPNTGMVVSTDTTTNLHDNHASNKWMIGERLAGWALAKTYGRESIGFSGPLYRGMKVEGDRIRVSFDHSVGLKSRDGKPLDWFTIAGADRKFVPAAATIEAGDKASGGSDTIVVHSDRVKEPVAVRFGWSGDAQPNLVNQAVLPASPFRSDDWPGVFEH